MAGPAGDQTRSTPAGGYDHDKYRRQACEVGITSLIARRGEEHGSGLGVYRYTLIEHLSGLNRPS
jgi:hypothetical protein